MKNEKCHFHKLRKFKAKHYFYEVSIHDIKLLQLFSVCI